jgi:hypothetical protein
VPQTCTSTQTSCRKSSRQLRKQKRRADENERLGAEPVPPEGQWIEQEPHDHDDERRQPDGMNAPTQGERDRRAGGERQRGLQQA